jgi:hypothetical protein
MMKPTPITSPKLAQRPMRRKTRTWQSLGTGRYQFFKHTPLSEFGTVHRTPTSICAARENPDFAPER